MKKIKHGLLGAAAFVAGFVSVAVIGGVLISSAGATIDTTADSKSDNYAAEETNKKLVYSVNANGQTYHDGAVDVPSMDDLPDLIGVVATNGKEGYVYKEDMYDYMPSCPEEAVKYMEVLKEFNDQGIYFQIIPVYAVDGETVIGEFEMFMDVGLSGNLSMDEARAAFADRRKLYEESRANGKYLRESMASVMEKAMAEDKE
ncbi:MAG: hypothetical protein HDT44_11940 [Ruminococcaceae bacterium]|nr:hypothetical protein [Oscillospiraceae bacterium]